MGLLIVLLLFVALPAGIAFALGRNLPRLRPGWSPLQRHTSASLAAGLLPVIVPIGAVVADGFDGQYMLWVAILLLAGLVTALIIGLPVALLAARKA